ncbi:MAG: MMPL family transporter [Gammaproteobacteria bacterium]|nr:MMPL family transporter [Gammaproteobacteria bacterium]
MNEVFANWVIRRRAWILAGTVLLVLLAAFGLRRLEFSNDYRVYFDETNPQLQAFEALQDMYSKTDNIQIAVAPKNGKVFTAKTLASVRWLTQQAWRLPYAVRVDSITNFQHTEAHGDDLVVRDLVVDPETLTPAQLEHIKRLALAEPLLAKRLLSAAADVTAVNVVIGLPGKKLDEVPYVMTALHQLVDQLRARDADINVYVSGAVPIDNAFSEQSLKDLRTLTPIMYGVILIVTFFILRSLAGVLAAIFIISFSTVLALGATGWFGIQLSPPSAGAPTVILTLAVAHCIHILMAVVHGMRHGLSKNAAIVESLRLNIYPISIAALTDVIGFLTMNYSDVPPFRDLGNIVTFGVVAAYALSIVFLPALLAILPLKVQRREDDAVTTMDRLCEFVIRRRRPLLVGMSLLVLGLVAMIPRNELNDNFVKYFDHSVEFRRDSDFIDGKLAGLDAMLYSVPAGGSGAVSDPTYLAKLEEFAAWYRTQPNVMHVTSIVDVMKRLNRNMHGDDPTWYRLPDSRQLAAQYLLLYEMSLPFGLDLNNQINVDKSASLMIVIMKSSTSKQILGLEARAQQWLAAHAPPTMKTTGTGPSVMFAYIGQRNISSMINGNIVALILISAVLMLVLRNIRVGLLSLIPNLAPAAMAFGVWGIFVGQVGLALAVVSVMTYGIVVDDTIHSMTKYMELRRQGMSPENAVRHIFSTIGSAAWAMSVILVLGFSVLAFSSFELNSSMGIMTALTIALALAGDFFLLPPLLMKFDRREYVASPVTAIAEPRRV